MIEEPPLELEEEEEAPEDPYAGEVSRGGAYGSWKRTAEVLGEAKEKAAAEAAFEMGEKHVTRPPLPVRRPPYSVTYAIQGRLYQAWLPGDCSARAEDGALIITHPEPVSGIVTVAPVGRVS